MKTHELLTAPEPEVVPQLKAMKIKDLEKHAEKLLKKLGIHDYDKVMASLIRTIPKLPSGNDQAEIRFATVQNCFLQFIPASGAFSSNPEHTDAVIQRLPALLMILVAKKFEKIHHKK